MNFSTRKLDYQVVGQMLGLKVAEDQQSFVAPNAVTIAQAQFEPGAHVFGMYDDEVAVGLMALVDLGVESPSSEDGDPKDGVYLWRLMVDKSKQQSGYGRAALEVSAEMTRDMGFSRLYVSVVKSDGGPQPFYERCGFVSTGRDLDGEHLLCRELG